MQPVIKDRPTFHVVGMCGCFEMETASREIPKLWERFVPRLSALPPVGGRTWGVCFAEPGTDAAPRTFFYMAAAEAADLSVIPVDMVGKTIPAARYAVFTHRGGLAGFPETIRKVWSEWLPAAGLTPSGAPDLELYDERFHPETGEIDILVPVE